MLSQFAACGGIQPAFRRAARRMPILYAIPHHLYAEHGLRRYGFHGTSHRYVAAEAAQLLGLRPLQDCALITATWAMADRIGPKKAELIVTERTAKEVPSKVEDLKMQVKGFGPATIEKNKDTLTFGTTAIAPATVPTR